MIYIYIAVKVCSYYYYCFTVFYRLGASIVVDTGTVLPVFARNLRNPLCFIQYPDRDVPPVQWEDVRTTYTNTLTVLLSLIMYRCL